MQLVSMKLSPAEAKEESGIAPSAEDAPRYPYGLCLDLDDETLKKLGITDMPAVGSAMQLIARVRVTRISQYENQEGADACLGLQITDMALEPAAPAARSAGDIATSLYG
ncbi:capsid staple protein [Cupriavidus basilensis]|uniref:capsid staple protein n=1 Tax=Cupriavidus basilensis TaxID=68895 RepID=UPI00075113F6|nr:hypothetical protein [Cupriavidus basilensis]